VLRPLGRQGGWEDDEPLAETAAAREAHEEAGVRGIMGATLASAEVTAKSKAHSVRIAWFALYVEELLDDWPEASERRRVVVPLDEAIGMVARPEHRAALTEV